MELTVETFLITVCTLVDDLYQTYYAAQRAHRPGPKGTMSASEVLTLALLGQTFPYGEHRWLRWVRQHWSAYFPRVLSQSAYNRRMRELTGVLLDLGPRVSQTIGALAGPSAYEVFD